MIEVCYWRVILDLFQINLNMKLVSDGKFVWKVIDVFENKICE